MFARLRLGSSNIHLKSKITQYQNAFMRLLVHTALYIDKDIKERSIRCLDQRPHVVIRFTRSR